MKVSFAVTLLTLFFSVFAAPTTEQRNLERVLFPNYLNPIKRAEPDIGFPTQYTGEVSYNSSARHKEVRLLVGFDVPAKVGTRCAIKFALPPKTPNGYQWVVTGSGKLGVFQLSEPFTNEETTWNNRPARMTPSPQFTITQPLGGGAAAMSGPVIPCLGGQRQDFEVAATGPDSTEFDWYELDKPSIHGITLNMYT